MSEIFKVQAGAGINKSYSCDGFQLSVALLVGLSPHDPHCVTCCLRTTATITYPAGTGLVQKAEFLPIYWVSGGSQRLLLAPSVRLC